LADEYGFDSDFLTGQRKEIVEGISDIFEQEGVP